MRGIAQPHAEGRSSFVEPRMRSPFQSLAAETLMT
jgi:hypothetical protein